MRQALLFSLLVLSSLFAGAQATFRLDGSKLTRPTFDTLREAGPGAYLNARNVHEAFIYWVPAQGLSTGTLAPTVLLCPGGGYQVLAFQKEGIDVARRLSAAGISVAVLMSRLPATENVPFPKLIALDDGRVALALLRRQQQDWQIDTARLSVLGFSAGGHLAMLLTTLDAQAERPKAAVLIYPVISMDTVFGHRGSRDALLGPNPASTSVKTYSGEHRVDAATPPTYLVHAADDRVVPLRNTLAYAAQLDAAAVPFAMQVLPKGGHGFGMHPPSGDYFDALIDWLKR